MKYKITKTHIKDTDDSHNILFGKFSKLEKLVYELRDGSFIVPILLRQFSLRTMGLQSVQLFPNFGALVL